jgi:hypothetical protein
MNLPMVAIARVETGSLTPTLSRGADHVPYLIRLDTVSSEA